MEARNNVGDTAKKCYKKIQRIFTNHERQTGKKNNKKKTDKLEGGSRDARKTRKLHLRRSEIKS